MASSLNAAPRVACIAQMTFEQAFIAYRGLLLQVDQRLRQVRCANAWNPPVAIQARAASRTVVHWLPIPPGSLCMQLQNTRRPARSRTGSRDAVKLLTPFGPWAAVDFRAVFGHSDENTPALANLTTSRLVRTNNRLIYELNQSNITHVALHHSTSKGQAKNAHAATLRRTKP